MTDAIKPPSEVVAKPWRDAFDDQIAVVVGIAKRISVLEHDDENSNENALRLCRYELGLAEFALVELALAYTPPPGVAEACQGKNNLPIAPLIGFEWSFRHFYFARFRLANAVRLQVGWLVVNIRAPWLEHSARVLHPEHYEERQP